MIRHFCPTLLAILLGLLLTHTDAARAGGWSVGVSVGVPFCHRPCFGPCFYRPYPVYVAPAPVYVPVAYERVPVVAPVAPTVRPVPEVSHAAYDGGREDDIARYQRQLQHPDCRERAEAAVQLGRLRAPGSQGTLTAALTNDRSPLVREAAARGLGLLGASDGLDSLQRAAQSDDDRDVRCSASYAADVIRANLSRR